MKKNDVEAKLRSAFSNAAPDVLPYVLEKCEHAACEPFVQKRSHAAAWRRAAAGLAAALAVTAGLFAFYRGGQDVDNPEYAALSASDAETYAQTYNALDMAALTPEEAVNIALRHLELDSGEIEESSAELEPGESGPIYLVKLSSGDTVYSLHVDAVTGEILKPAQETK